MKSKFYSSILLHFTLLFFANSIFAQCSFSISNQITCGQSIVHFSLDGLGSGVYSWDFESDGNIDDYGPNVSFVFPANSVNQTYTVSLYQNGTPCEADTVYVLAVPDAAIGLVPAVV